MGVTERKERQRAELREQILAAARRIVVRDGFEALTMRKIAEAIEYSPATIYLHFENREAIGRQLCAESFEHLLAYLSDAAAVADPGERLRAIGRAYVRFGLENAEEYRLVFMTDSAFMEALFVEELHGSDDPGARAFDFLVQTVRACQARGEIAAVEPTLVAEALWTTMHGIVSMALTCRKAIESPLDALTETVLSALANGLAALDIPKAP